jgi:hypothetical protein
MADAFDPYFTWLSIPRDKRPINFYQLLGLKEFTDDADVIENAVHRQTAHVQTFLDGDHAADAKTILQQLSQAHSCLLAPERKAKYDTGLRAKRAASEQPVKAKPRPQAAPAAERPKSAEGTNDKSIDGDPPQEFQVVVRSQTGQKNSLLKVAIAALLLIGAIGFAAVKFWPKDVEPSDEQPDGPVAARENATSNDSGPPPPDKVDEGKPDDGATNPPDDVPDANRPNLSDPMQDDPVLDDPVDDPDPAPSPPDLPVNDDPMPVGPAEQDPMSPSDAADHPPMDDVVPDRRASVPSAAEHDQAADLVNEVYADELAAAETPEKKVALAESMLGAGRTTDNDPNGRYVVYRTAGHLALDAGDLSLALRIVDQIEKDYQLDAWPLREQLVTKIMSRVKGRDELKAAAEAVFALAGQALAEKKPLQAETFSDTALKTARRVRDTDLIKTIALFRNGIALQAKLAKEVETARTKLQDDPDDAGAHLTVGKYLCLFQDDWQGGLPHLVKGSDADLQAVAKRELEAPNETGDMIELADAWWALSTKANDDVKNPMLLRSGHWYEKALPMAKALNKVKAERRLTEIAKRLPSGGVADAGGRDRRSKKLVVKQVVYLDDLEEAVSNIGWGKLGKHGKTGYPVGIAGAISVDSILFRGKQPLHALSTHPAASSSSFVDYNLGGKFHLFIGIAGFIDSNSAASRPSALTFRVIGDNKLLWRSWPSRTDGQHARVGVTGVRRLRLQVDCPGKNAEAWAAWMMPRVVQFKSSPRREQMFADVHPRLNYPRKPHPTAATQFNGHWYAFVPSTQITGKFGWHEAQVWCEERGGYLACIETMPESEFVSRLAGNSWAYLGGVKDVDGKWRWINGPEMTFKRWGTNEPNDSWGKEIRLNMFSNGDWNDSAQYSGFVKGFICEWES